MYIINLELYTYNKNNNMTKKDYIKIAKMFKDQSLIKGDNEKETKIAQNMRDIIIYELCDIFKADNPNFDKDTFMKASFCDYYNENL